MTIYLTEVEAPERAAFQKELPEHELHFVDEAGEVGPDAEVLSVFINSQIDGAYLEAHPQLRYVATRSGAVDHLDIAACRERGVLVSNVPEYGDETVAEHTFALILALSRRLREIMSKVQTPTRFTYEGARAFDLHGKTIGVVGYGHIGRRVAELARAFRMRVVVCDPKRERLEPHSNVEWLSLEALLAAAHITTLHVQLSPETYHLLNRETLAHCRPGALIINTSRGRLIHTEALYEALQEGRLGGAGLDVLEQEGVLRHSASHILGQQIIEHLRADVEPHESEHGGRLQDIKEIVAGEALLARHDVVFTPHVAFNSEEAFARLHHGSVANLRAFLAGTPVNLIDAPPASALV